MRAILRYLDKLNQKYDQVREPYRIMIFMGPLMLTSIIAGLLIILDLSIFGHIMLPITVMVLAIFRIPIMMINKKWINTYTVGWPYKFKYAVKVEYIFKEGRKEISEWTAKNSKFYYGIFTPDELAIFYFARPAEAMAFKLRW